MVSVRSSDWPGVLIRGFRTDTFRICPAFKVENIDYESEKMFNVMKIQLKEVYFILDFENAFPLKNFLFALFHWKNLPMSWSKIQNEIEIFIFTFEFYFRKNLRYHNIFKGYFHLIVILILKSKSTESWGTKSWR